MPGYNSKFELSVEDMELIEGALRQIKADLSARTLAKNPQHLLGRLHNQKVFYRPRRGAYIGG